MYLRLCIFGSVLPKLSPKLYLLNLKLPFRFPREPLENHKGFLLLSSKMKDAR